MRKTNADQQTGKGDDLPTVIAFHAGTDWTSQLHLDLNSHLVTHPSATFFVRVKGNSSNHPSILNDDILIVDRALPPTPDCTIVAVVDGSLIIAPYQSVPGNRRQDKGGNRSDVRSDSTDSAVWGVVTYVIHKA